MKNFFVVLATILSFTLAKAQEKNYKVACIGFYNLENLYDTIPNNRLGLDEEFTPSGAKAWRSSLYQDKLTHLDEVISQLATDLTPDGVAVLGVSEIENRHVLEDLVQQDRIKSRNYQIVHYDSPDERGVDVAMLYNPKYFTLLASKPIFVDLTKAGGNRPTRDVLYVKGLLDGDTVHILVNHWPSRRGGEGATKPLRNYVALICKNVTDSLLRINDKAKVMVMGDLNDDPVNESIADILGAKGSKDKLRRKEMFNPMYAYYKEGMGTLAHQDAWNLFDQIIISEQWTDRKASGYRYYQAKVFRAPFLFEQKAGPYKGYPKRTFSGDRYNSGYSDHLPVYLVMLKER